MPVMEMADLAPAKTLVNDACDRCGGRYEYLTTGKDWFLGCGNCWHPAPEDHPDQIRLRNEYAEKAIRDKKASENQKANLGGTAKSVGMITLLEERFAAIEKRMAEQDARIEQLLSAIAEQQNLIEERLEALAEQTKKAGKK